MNPAEFVTVDENGRLILPEDLAAAWGLAPGSQLPLEKEGQAVRLRPPVTTLRRVYVELTNGCNLSCTTCMRNVWAVETGSMSDAVYERLLTGIQDMQPAPEIFIGGYGEPLSHPGCLEMVARARSIGLRVSLITNGILLTQEVSEQLIDLELDSLWVSIDGASPECYTDVRLGNALPLIIKNLKTLQQLQYLRFGYTHSTFRPRLGIAFVAMRRNLADLPEVIRLGKSLGATEFSVTNVLAHDAELRQESLYRRSLDRVGSPGANRWKPFIQFPTMDIDPAIVKIIGELLRGNLNVSLFGQELGGNGDRCPFINKGSLTVRWDGKVSPCLPLLYTHTHYLDTRLRTSREYFVGDVLADDLGDIWNAKSYLALRRSLEHFDFSPCVMCNSCEMADSNLEDCFGNVHPTCGGCLWAQGLICCP